MPVTIPYGFDGWLLCLRSSAEASGARSNLYPDVAAHALLARRRHDHVRRLTSALSLRSRPTPLSLIGQPRHVDGRHHTRVCMYPLIRTSYSFALLPFFTQAKKQPYVAPAAWPATQNDGVSSSPKLLDTRSSEATASQKR